VDSSHHGDSLDILRRYLKEEAANVVYLELPFNSSTCFDERGWTGVATKPVEVHL
jgi:hypothetical protein